MPVVLSTTDGATVEVHPHGAHVTSWRPAPGNHERLFLSARSRFGGGSAIRGGIPVIFPQFAAEGPLPRHGFARTMEWTQAAPRDERHSHAAFTLDASAATRAIWPAEFRATLDVSLERESLSVMLTVENRGSQAFSFSAALHTYLRVTDVAQCELVGLAGAHYRESGDPSRLITDHAPVLRITGEVDRVYVNAPRRLVLREPARELTIEASSSFPDVVVWNPGAARAAALDDMEPGGEQRMLCVEAAAVQLPIVLEPGGQWSGSQTLIA